MAVGTIRAFVIDVNDLEVGERFWCAVTGLDVLFSGWPESPVHSGAQGQFSGLGTGKSHSVLLQLVPEGIGHNRPFNFRGVWRVSTFRSNQAPAKRDDLVDRVIDILDSDVNMRPVLEIGLRFGNELQ